MPFVNVKLIDGVFSSEQKHELAKALTDVMVRFEGSEAFREVVWVLIEELHTGYENLRAAQAAGETTAREGEP